MKHLGNLTRMMVVTALAAMLYVSFGVARTHAQSSSRDGTSREEGSSRGDGRDEGRRRWGERFGRRDRGEEDRGRDERSTSSNNGGSTSAPPSSTSTSRPAASSGDAGASMGMESYAKSLVSKYDKNSNMMLEADERGELKGEAAKSDLNNDGVITVTELVTHLSSGAPAAAPSTPSNGGGAATGSVFDASRNDANRRADSGGSNSRSGDNPVRRVYTALPTKLNEQADKRHSSRFISPTERLPTGLPSFFKSNDKNGDGQVSMNEYSRTWSKSKVDEFRKYDRNDDGIITAKEAAAKP